MGENGMALCFCEAKKTGPASVPMSQDVAALPAIPEDKGCQELSGCPGQMPSILLATETFPQTKPYTEQSDPAPWASPHPTDPFQQPHL